VFENLIEFHSLALPNACLSYELSLEEKLITFVDSCENEYFKSTRDFNLLVEKEGKLWLRRV